MTYDKAFAPYPKARREVSKTVKQQLSFSNVVQVLTLLVLVIGIGGIFFRVGQKDQTLTTLTQDMKTQYETVTKLAEVVTSNSLNIREIQTELKGIRQRLTLGTTASGV